MVKQKDLQKSHYQSKPDGSKNFAKLGPSGQTQR